VYSNDVYGDIVLESDKLCSMMDNSSIVRRNIWRYDLSGRFTWGRPVASSAWKGEVRVYRIFVVFLYTKI